MSRDDLDGDGGLTEALGELTPLGHAALPEEIANAVTLLVSPSASDINGAILQTTDGHVAIAP